MITVRRSDQRHHDRRRQQDCWRTFSSKGGDGQLAAGFGALELLNEDRLAPGASVSHPHHDAEIVLYVREGAVTFEDAQGASGVIHAGEFHRRTASRGVRHTETNASQVDSAHVFQIWLRPSSEGPEPGHEQRRFSAADRRGLLCVVASPDARRSSLRLHADALICSAMLDRGQHVVHELVPGRTAWLHLVSGQATLDDVVLVTGDGAGVTAGRAVSLTAREETEILLIDLAAVH